MYINGDEASKEVEEKRKRVEPAETSESNQTKTSKKTSKKM